MMNIRTAAIIISAAAALTACERRTPPANETAPPAAPAPANQAPPVASERPAQTAAPEARGIVMVAGLTIPVPQGWVEVQPANTMRLAELHIPGEPVPTTITFVTAGGDVRANLDRWAAQFSGGGQPSYDTRTVQGMTVHTAEMDGTYRNMGEPPREGFALRGAVVEGPRGMLFIKMAGPAAQVASESDAFYEMLDGIWSAGS